MYILKRILGGGVGPPVLLPCLHHCLYSQIKLNWSVSRKYRTKLAYINPRRVFRGYVIVWMSILSKIIFIYFFICLVGCSDYKGVLHIDTGSAIYCKIWKHLVYILSQEMSRAHILW